MAYNLPGINQLNFSRSLLVGIYNGSVSHWNDPQVEKINPGILLPNAPIKAIARAEKSGTTEIFTSALSSFDALWNSTYGTFNVGLDSDGKPVHWDDGVIAYYGLGNRGVSGLVLSIAYTVAYISIADASDARLKYAKIYNVEGFLVGPDIDNVQSAMDVRADSFTDRFTMNLVDVSGELSYPIIGYSYFILYLEHPNSCASAIELYRYMEWFMFDESAHEDCISSNFVPLSFKVGSRILKHMKKHLHCDDKVNVYGLVKEQKNRENESKQSWKLPTLISIGIMTLLVFIMLAFIAQREIRLNWGLIQSQWAISLHEILFLETKQSRYSSVSEPREFEHGNIFCGQYNSKTVLLRPTLLTIKDSLRISTKRALLSAKSILHPNVAQFCGITYVDNYGHLVMSMDMNGVLHDIIRDPKYNLDENFKFCLAMDAVSGMSFLHTENIIHGYLTSKSCFIDMKWNVKIGDWVYHKLACKQRDMKLMYRDNETSQEINDTIKRQFWIAPELLSSSGDPRIVSKEGDVYSFSIMLIEIFSQSDPYSHLTDLFDPSDILLDIVSRDVRPAYPPGSSQKLKDILDACWAKEPSVRLSSKKLKKMLEKARPSKKGAMDCLMEALESRTRELDHAIGSMQSLLYQILPPSVATKLQKGETVDAESYECVTIYFSDIVGFTSISSLLTPMQIVQFLNCLYTCFDNVLDLYDVYKVETIGDAYMVISGLPNRNGKQHAREIASVALDLMDAAQSFQIPNLPNEPLQLRSGIHSGPVASGVVGVKMPRFCLFGDAVNIASRMESTSVAMKVQVSNDCRQLLDEIGGFVMELRGKVSVKGKGNMSTYWLKGKKMVTSDGQVCL